MLLAANSALAVVPGDDACRAAMYRNGRLRLLMTLSGFELLGDDTLGGSWIIPSSIPSLRLEETQSLIQQHLDNPADEIDGLDPRRLLRRKRVTNMTSSSDAAFPEVDFGNDSEGEDNADDILFPPNSRSKQDALASLKQKRSKKRKTKSGSDDDEEGLDEETIEARRLARKNNALARQRKIKSDLYVHASDEEEDEEADRRFFAREEERRRTQANQIREALNSGVLDADSNEDEASISAGTRKRKSTGDQSAPRKRQHSASPSSPGEDNGEHIIDSTSGPLRAHPSTTPPTSAEDDLGSDSRHNRSSTPLFSRMDKLNNSQAVHDKGASNPDAGENGDSDDDDDTPVSRPTRRPRVMGGFVVDSDSD